MSFEADPAAPKPRVRTIRTTMSLKPAEASPAASAKPEPLPDTPSGEARKFVPAKKPPDILVRPFFVCLAVGFVLAFFGRVRGLEYVGLLGPIAMTAAYPIWGLMRGVNQRASLRERFADNAYYLGFIFTQISLLVGFGVPALLRQALTSADVLRYFGIAIGASMIGLIARTFLVQTGHSVSENADIVEDEVEQLAREVELLARGVASRAREMLTDLEGVAGEIGRTRTALTTEIGASVRAATTSFEAQSATLQGQMANTARMTSEVANDFETSFRHLLGTVRGLDTLLARDLDGLGAHLRQAAGAVEGVGTSFAKGSDAITALQGQLSAQIVSTSDTAAIAAASLARGVDALQRLADLGPQLGALETRVAGLTGRTDDLAESFRVARAATERAGEIALASVQASGGQVEFRAQALAASLSDSLDASVKALEAVLESFRSELERVRG